MSTSRLSLIGLPLSIVSRMAISRARSCKRRAMRNRYLPRSFAGSAAHFGCASRAAFTAASMSSAVPRATLDSFCSLAGLIVSNVPPFDASTNAPLMKWPYVSAISTLVVSGAGAYSQALANSSAGDRPGPDALVFTRSAASCS